MICNEGYTVERFIHGWDAEYNDIQLWNHKSIVNTFGAKEGAYRTYTVKTKDETEALFHDEAFNSADVLQFVELYMPKDDAPRALKLTAEMSAKINAKE